MWFSLSEQTLYFLYSIVFGLILGALYDFSKLLRYKSKRLSVTVSVDVLFFLLCAFMSVMFSLPFNDGTVRLFNIFGEIIGFVVFRLTAGCVTSKICIRICRVIKALFNLCAKFLKIFFNFLLKMIKIIVYNLSEKKENIQNIVFDTYKGQKYERKKAKNSKRKNRKKA